MVNIAQHMTEDIAFERSKIARFGHHSCV